MIKRRSFLSLLGKGAAGTILLPSLYIGCRNRVSKVANLASDRMTQLKSVILKGIKPISSDNVELAEGLSYKTLVKWMDPISTEDSFGFNNDFTCFVPLSDDGNDGLLWVNHESTDTVFVSNYKHGDIRTMEQVEKEMYSVGGSIIRVKNIDGSWEMVKNDPYNRRITAQTELAINWDSPIMGKTTMIGTHSNCSGGITPWGTILTCEENYQDYYGETEYDEENNPKHKDSIYGWEKMNGYPTEHYGWVVEIDPLTGKGMKHIALGRFSHECCTLVELEDKRIVAYSGDDQNDEFIYKFISSKSGSLKEGTLYVADTDNGKWLSLDYKTQPTLQEKFKDQTEVLIRVREAARLVGATPQDRPEDIEIDPITGHVVIALTNNKPKNRYHGTILKLIETDNQYDSLTFTTEAMATGGIESGFSCPDNLAFDLAGNLWFTSDISGSSMNNKEIPQYLEFKNNGLFVVIRYGEEAGKIIQLASAPMDAEFTGPWFSPDYKTLFLSVQHPGGSTMSLDKLTSTWPHDEDGLPKPSVITIEGDLLEKLNFLDKLQ